MEDDDVLKSLYWIIERVYTSTWLLRGKSSEGRQAVLKSHWRGRLKKKKRKKKEQMYLLFAWLDGSFWNLWVILSLFPFYCLFCTKFTFSQPFYNVTLHSCKLVDDLHGIDGNHPQLTLHWCQPQALTWSLLSLLLISLPFCKQLLHRGHCRLQ